MDSPTPRAGDTHPTAGAAPDPDPVDHVEGADNTAQGGGRDKEQAVPRRLVGVGVGPGDPELVTVKAVRALAAADVILVPETEVSRASGRSVSTDADRNAAAPNPAPNAGAPGGPTGGLGRAERIVLACCPEAAGAVRRVPFSMADRSGVTERRREAWETSAAAALAAYDEGAWTVAMATVGDPSVYSTFSYLAATVTRERPDVQVEVIPGITAMQALAAASRTPLVEGTEVLALVPITAGLTTLDDALASADTVVAYKSGRWMPEVARRLRGAGRAATTVVGTDVSLPQQELIGLDEIVEGHKAPYFCTVLSAPARDSIGGRL